ncbi:FkbM family methyltransferase [Methanocalculus chunghsingensis]|uniref:FkbM family methyltransferase n=1 Tax=Methanocalculus chunghsingensis TaxID=156457 RepID=UPI001B8BE9D7|nr:FkbM family methyltransferase [Methanocalculus chunghsingensis]
MSLIRDAHTIYKYNDFVDLFLGVCRYVSRNGHSEMGIASAHGLLTEHGDRVVIVGGGDGATALTAAKKVGRTGLVTIYEGGDRAVRQMEERLAIEGVAAICSVHHAIVGPNIDVYGGDAANAVTVDPKDLPDCDILELDCEGSEIDILRSLRIRPRVIIVEIHPFLFPDDPCWVLDRLAALGYRIIYRSGHDGIQLDDQDLRKLLTRSRDCGVIYLKNGARSPGVVAAVRDE